MSSRWLEIWNKRGNKFDPSQNFLDQLLIIDGYDTKFSSLTTSDFLSYVNWLIDKIGVLQSDTIFEVGCGAGAFLFTLKEKGHCVSGIDYASNLVQIAHQVLGESAISLGEALDLKLLPKFSIVLANSVFHYFNNLAYSEKVILKMIDKAIKVIAILDIPDIDLKDEAIIYRKGKLNDKEYEKQYDGLDHLYFSRSWFELIAQKNNLQIEIFNQNIPNYGNNRFRFSVILRKG